MGLKEEIKHLRGELDQPEVDEKIADHVRKGAETMQAKVTEGLDRVEKRVRAAKDAVTDATSPDNISSMRDSLSSSLAQVGSELERVPSKYPTLTALSALGFGLALGLSLGRKLR